MKVGRWAELDRRISINTTRQYETARSHVRRALREAKSG